MDNEARAIWDGLSAAQRETFAEICRGDALGLHATAHQLRDMGLTTYADGEWRLTPKGREVFDDSDCEDK